MSKKLRRKIYITEEISSESYTKFSKRLTALEAQGNGDIEIELFSHGGEAYAALAFSARMRGSPCKLIVRANGLVASAAVMILAAGDHRIMARDAWLMVHEDAGEFSGNVTDIQKVSTQLNALEDQWARLLAERSSTDAIYWRALHKDSKYITATQCLDLGLVEELV